MPRLSHQPPRYRKHRASGQAVVTINGRDHYLGPHGTKTSKREYDRLIAEWLSSGRSSSYGNHHAEFTVVEMVRDFLAYAKRFYGVKKRGTYANLLLGVRPLKELYGRLPAAGFGVL